MFIKSLSGIKVDLLNPTPDMININDIAVQLSREGRFANATKFHYSVGQHSLYACGLAPEHLKLEALLDDAEEAYTRDLPKPFKILMTELMNSLVYKPAHITYNASPFDIVARKLKQAIAEKFQLDYKINDKRTLKVIDNSLGITEGFQLVKEYEIDQHLKDLQLEPYDFEIIPMSNDEVSRKFLELFEEYRRT